MKPEEKKIYRSCRKEFKALKKSGCILCYPSGEEVGTKEMAARIARDPKATYMRDPTFRPDGTLEKISFQRVELP